MSLNIKVMWYFSDVRLSWWYVCSLRWFYQTGMYELSYYIPLNLMSKFWLIPVFNLSALQINFKLFGFPIFRFSAYLMKVIPEMCHDFQRTWWRLFQKRVMIFSVPDEGYSRNVSWFSAYLMKVIPEMCHDFQRTWWRLFQKRVVRTVLISTFFYPSFLEIWCFEISGISK